MPAEKRQTAPVVKPLGESTYEDGSIEIHADRITTPMVTKTNKPFIKQLFAGVFDTDMLTYPEVETNEDLARLEAFVKPYEDLFLSAQVIDFAGKDEIPLEFVTAMADVGLFAQAIPEQYGGLELDSTYLTRMADITGSIPMAHNLIEVHHNIATKLILSYGTEEQKRKFLPRLATGEMIATLCLHETKTHLDFLNLKARASIIEDKERVDSAYLLNGYKTWVANAHMADLFLVVAQTPVDVAADWKDEGCSMFIVEATREGVTVSERIQGIESPRGLPLFDVTFENISLAKGDILGKTGEADLMTIHAMTASAHHVGASTAALLKRFTNMLQYYLVTEKTEDVPLYENQSYQKVLAQLQCTAFIMESMAYMTGQIVDEYEEPDWSVEQAATRVWCVEKLHSQMGDVMEVMGLGSLEKKSPLMAAYLDTLALKNYPIPLDLMKQYIALSGIRYCIGEKASVHKVLRDALNEPKIMIKRMMMLEDVPTPYQLFRHVHNILHPTAIKLENVCKKFDKAIEAYLVHGPASGSFLQDQMELARLASIVSEIFAMVCILSRASRSLCLGVQHSGRESVMAQFYIAYSCKRLEIEISEIKGEGPTDGQYYWGLAKDIIENKAYMPQHPLTRTF